MYVSLSLIVLFCNFVTTITLPQSLFPLNYKLDVWGFFEVVVTSRGYELGGVSVHI